MLRVTFRYRWISVTIICRVHSAEGNLNCFGFFSVTVSSTHLIWPPVSGIHDETTDRDQRLNPSGHESGI
jgi:hypothetical protein